MDAWDRIDRQHRAPAPVRLECEDCGASGDHVMRRYSMRAGDPETRVLCWACWLRWR